MLLIVWSVVDFCLWFEKLFHRPLSWSVSLNIPTLWSAVFEKHCRKTVSRLTSHVLDARNAIPIAVFHHSFNHYLPQSAWELWFTKWHWDKFPPKYSTSSVPLSLLFHQYSAIVLDFYRIYIILSGHAVAQWLRHCDTNRKVAGLISDGVIGIFNWYNPSGRTMALGSTQPLM
jgi:hypothetical protein